MRIWFFLYLGWAVSVIWFSLVPSPPEITLGPMAWDKFQHAAAYAVMTLLGGMALRRWLHSPGRCWLFSAAIALLIGVLVEAAQGAMAVGRFAEWQDAAANAAGVAGALALVAVFRYFRSRAT